MSFIFHCFANPTVPCNLKNIGDAFNQFAIKFSELMTNNGHEVLFYSNSREKIICSEFIQVLTEDDYIMLEKNTFPFNDGRYLMYNSDTENHKNNLKKIYEEKTINILKDKIRGDKKKEFFFHFYNCATKNISLAYPYIQNVEMMMGCSSFFCKNVLFASVSFLTDTLEHMKYVPKNYEIIPPLFKKTEFEYKNVKVDNTFLYLARIQKCKGVDLIFELAKALPKVYFVIAGAAHCEKNILYVPYNVPNNPNEYTPYNLKDYPNINYIGFADITERKDLLSNCCALIQPTPYKEPFGFNIIEAYLSGTPVITSANGAFLETVKNGVTGYLCSTFEDYIEAITNVNKHKIKSYTCYQEGLRYEIDNHKIYQKYMKFFKNSV